MFDDIANIRNSSRVRIESKLGLSTLICTGSKYSMFNIIVNENPDIEPDVIYDIVVNNPDMCLNDMLTIVRAV